VLSLAVGLGKPFLQGFLKNRWIVFNCAALLYLIGKTWLITCYFLNASKNANENENEKTPAHRPYPF
jgi:hypothetical protein